MPQTGKTIRLAPADYENYNYYQGKRGERRGWRIIAGLLAILAALIIAAILWHLVAGL